VVAFGVAERAVLSVGKNALAWMRSHKAFCGRGVFLGAVAEGTHDRRFRIKVSCIIANRAGLPSVAGIILIRV